MTEHKSDMSEGLQRFYVERIKTHQASMADPGLFKSAQLAGAWIERCAIQDAYSFRRLYSLAGQQKTETVEYPADWWQAFKGRWFPAWALLRWPVRVHPVNFHAVRVFDGVPAPVADRQVYYSVSRREWDEP